MAHYGRRGKERGYAVKRKSTNLGWVTAKTGVAALKLARNRFGAGVKVRLVKRVSHKQFISRWDD